MCVLEVVCETKRSRDRKCMRERDDVSVIEVVRERERSENERERMCMYVCGGEIEVSATEVVFVRAG